MMYIWTLVLVLSTAPNVQLSLIMEFRTEADCREAVQASKLDEKVKAELKCIQLGYQTT